MREIRAKLERGDASAQVLIEMELIMKRRDERASERQRLRHTHIDLVGLDLWVYWLALRQCQWTLAPDLVAFMRHYSAQNKPEAGPKTFLGGAIAMQTHGNLEPPCIAPTAGGGIGPAQTDFLNRSTAKLCPGATNSLDASAAVRGLSLLGPPTGPRWC